MTRFATMFGFQPGGPRAALRIVALLLGVGVLPTRADAVGTVRRVPSRYPTIQGAVDAAMPGDLVLIDRGIYREAVVVRVPSLVIRGRERATVVIDGEGIRATGIEVTADGVAVENLTVRGHREQGILWRGVHGYQGRFLTVHDNAVRGLSLDRAVDGRIEDSYVSGSAEAGIAVAQCGPCRLVVRRVVVEHNGAGFAAREASGALFLLNSIWRHNRVGLLPHGMPSGRDSTATVIRGNLIHDNGDRTAPGRGRAALAWGNGVLISGAQGVLVADNVIVGHVGHGVLIAPVPWRGGESARANRIERNVILSSGRAGISVGGPRTQGNCIGDQQGHVTRAPAWFSCIDGQARGVDNDLVPALTFLLRRWRLGGRIDSLPSTLILPPPLPSLADADRAAVVPPVAVFSALGPALDSIQVPAEADSIRREATIAGVVPNETPHLGAFLAGFQELVPLSRSLLALVLTLLVGWRGGIVWWRRRGHTGRKALRAWRVAVFLTVVWIGLALVVAASFSGV